MENIHKLRKFYQLKNVERVGPVGNRKESSAEHSWSTLVLADYFLEKSTQKLDRLKIYEILMYHDIVEIEVGDIPIHHEEARKNKKVDELNAIKKLRGDFPNPMGKKVFDLFTEFEEEITKEAKFAKAIDKIDALIHFLDYKEYWKGWTEEQVRRYHGEAISKVPEVVEVFETILTYVKENGYFSQ